MTDRTLAAVLLTAAALAAVVYVLWLWYERNRRSWQAAYEHGDAEQRRVMLAGAKGVNNGHHNR